MVRHIKKLTELGIPLDEATAIVLSISHDAYEEGYTEGQFERPAIIGETLGQSGKDFYQWWEEQILK